MKTNTVYSAGLDIKADGEEVDVYFRLVGIRVEEKVVGADQEYSEIDFLVKEGSEFSLEDDSELRGSAGKLDSKYELTYEIEAVAGYNHDNEWSDIERMCRFNQADVIDDPDIIKLANELMDQEEAKRDANNE